MEELYRAVDTTYLMCQVIKAHAAVQEMEKHRRYALFKLANQVKEQEVKEKSIPITMVQQQQQQQQQVQPLYIAPTTSMHHHHQQQQHAANEEEMDMEDDGF